MSQAFENGVRRATEEIRNKVQNQAQLVAITYQENGREVKKPVSSDAEADRLTRELDRKGIEWMAQYSSGWK